MTTEPTLETQLDILTTILVEEQESLWGDLAEARNRSLARPGALSIAEEGIIERIGVIAAAVGPTDPGSVHTRLVLDGVYEKALAKFDVEVPDFDRDSIQATYDAHMARRALLH